MLKTATVISVSAFLLLVSSAAYCQEPAPTYGVMLGNNGVGLVWHVMDRVTIRPDFVATRSATDGETSTNTNFQVIVGVSGLFDVAKIGDLAIYVGARVAHNHQGNRTESHSTPITSTVTSSGPGYEAAGIVGAHYSFHRRFGVYVESGFGYRSNHFTQNGSNSTGQSYRTEYTSSTGSLRTVVGGIVYF